MAVKFLLDDRVVLDQKLIRCLALPDDLPKTVSDHRNRLSGIGQTIAFSLILPLERVNKPKLMLYLRHVTNGQESPRVLIEIVAPNG